MNLFEFPSGTLHRHPKHGIGYIVEYRNPRYVVEFVNNFLGQVWHQEIDHDSFQPLEAANDTR